MPELYLSALTNTVRDQLIDTDRLTQGRNVAQGVVISKYEVEILLTQSLFPM